MKTYVGIDPGKTGSVVVMTPVDIQNPGSQVNLATDLKCTLAYMNGTIVFWDAETNIDLALLGERLNRDNDAFVLLEKPQIMHPKRYRSVDGQMVVEKAPQGVVGMLNYGIGYGEYLGMLKTRRIPYGEIHPMTWKKEFNLIDKPKQSSIETARNLFPMVSDMLKRKKDHGRAEALLLAEFARRKNY